MINKIIKDWVEEEINGLNNVSGPFSINIRVAQELALQDLTSRIPQLTERIVEEIEKLLIQQEAKLDNCNNVDGRVQDECFKRNRRAKDWNEIIRRIINTLKGGKEN